MMQLETGYIDHTISFGLNVKNIHNTNNKSLISFSEIDHIDHTTLLHFGYEENHTQQQNKTLSKVGYMNHTTLFSPVTITNRQHRNKRFFYHSYEKKTHEFGMH